jgi:histone-lysine N-methyltransferase ASH1L
MFAGERLLKMGRDFELPFDIYSPLPPGQPKPNEWRKTNKST